MKNLDNIQWILIALILLMSIGATAQDPKRFQKSIDELVTKEYNFDTGKELVVFSGSSSIKLWKDVDTVYPEYNVINNGFGGSHFSDLIYYYNEVIVRPQPDILFIYEGDNDVASGKKATDIIKEARILIKQIKKDLPDTRIIIISVKPSVARKEFKAEYIKLNRLLEKLAKRTKGVEFADVWNAMVDQNGDVYTDIFVDDNLHLNKKGYKIWAEVIGKHLPKSSVDK